MQNVNIIVDAIFYIDIILTFFSVIEDKSLNEIDDPGQIACKYFKGWIYVDVLAVVPFDQILEDSTNSNRLIRVVRLGKLYKLLKLLRLIRVMKVLKQVTKITEAVKINQGVSKLITLFFMFIMAVHILACIWIFFAVLNIDDDNKENKFTGTWLEPYKQDHTTNAEIYLISIYWIITTLSTVGYGDISANNVSERIYCIILMMAGTVWFSYINGTIFSLLQTYDATEAALDAKFEFLDNLKNDYEMSPQLYLSIRRNLEFSHTFDYSEIEKFIALLPSRLRIQVQVLIYEKRFSDVRFF